MKQILLMVVTGVVLFFTVSGGTSLGGDSGSSGSEDAPETFFRGRVVSVTDFDASHVFGFLEQEAEVQITGGPFKGKSVRVRNVYDEDDPYLNVYLEENDEILLVGTVADGRLQTVDVHDVIRDRGLYYLLGIFVILLLGIGRIQGLKTLITLAFTGLVVVRGVIPLLLAGYSPIPVATVSATVVIVFTLLVIGGINAKSFSAIVGTVCGVTVAGILALWVGKLSSLTGFSSEEARMLLFMDHPINVRGLLFAGIIIGSLGAVTDVGMSVASAASEIRAADPRISAYRLVRAGMNVGRDIMGTMSNTLVLAYAGGALPLLLLLVGYEMEWLRIVNMDLIATEFVRGIAGSIGLIVSIPVTAVMAGFLMGAKQSESRRR